MTMDLPAGVTYRPAIHVDKLTARQRDIVREFFPARDGVGRLDGSAFRFHADQADIVVNVLKVALAKIESPATDTGHGLRLSTRSLLSKVERAIEESK